MLLEIPLLAGQAVADFSASAYHAFITAMHKAAPVKAAKAPVTMKFTITGKPSVKITGRKPPYVMQSEFLALCREHSIRQNVLFLHLKKRGIPVTNGTEVNVTLDKT